MEDCILMAESRFEHHPSDIPRLTEDKAFAIATYSYDLGIEDKKRNIFSTLNNVLKERNPKKMGKLAPFLSFLMSGHSKLPPVKVTVYCGISKTAFAMI